MKILLNLFLISFIFLGSCNDNKNRTDESTSPVTVDSIQNKKAVIVDEYRRAFINSINPDLIPIQTRKNFVFGYMNSLKRDSSWGIVIFKDERYSDSLKCYYNRNTTHAKNDFQMVLEPFFHNCFTYNLYLKWISKQQFEKLIENTGLLTYEPPIVGDPEKYDMPYEALYIEAFYNNHTIPKIKETRHVMDKLEPYLLDSIINPLFKQK